MNAAPAVAADPVAASGNRWVTVAAVFGRLVAQGMMARGEALAPLQAAAAARLPAMDASGRDMRLAWALDDAIAGWKRARERTRFAVRRALAPLLAERAPSARLLLVARAVNGEAGDPLTEREVLEEVRREVFWAARRAAGADKARRQA